MNDLSLIIEALLITTSEPLSIAKLVLLLEDHIEKPSAEDIKKQIEILNKAYTLRAFEIKCIADGYRIQTKTQFNTWIAKMQAEKPPKYSRAMLESLAIIAYKQPVTRADIESQRGVSLSSPILKTLLERGWIRVAGHKDVPGKPAVYTTTPEFLNYFNLQSLSDLPVIESRE